jgi:ubiquinone/menaquinone biosynthesis C-methylase UbiE
VDPQLQLRVQRYGWDKAAGDYERYWASALEPAQNRLLQRAQLRSGERVLDVACGTGLVTFRIASTVGATGSVLAADISDEMVNTLRTVAAERGLKQIRAERMDGEALAVPDGSFDLAVCALGLMYMPDPLAALKEMHRALRAGGRVAVAVWGSREHCGWAEIFPIVEKRVASEVCPLFFQLGNGDALKMTMEMAGFTDVIVERMTTTIRYENENDAVGAAFAGGPVALAYSKFDQATKMTAHAEYLASISGYRRGNGYEVPGEFVIARGAKGGQ